MQVKAPVPWLVPLAPTEGLVELRKLSSEPCQLRVTGKAKRPSLGKGWLPEVILAGSWVLLSDCTP